MLVKHIIELLGIDSPVIIQDVCILLCDHGCLRMTRITLNGFDIAAVQFELVCNTGMPEAVEDYSVDSRGSIPGAKGLLAASFQQNAPEAMLSHASGVFSVVIITT